MTPPPRAMRMPAEGWIWLVGAVAIVALIVALAGLALQRISLVYNEVRALRTAQFTSMGPVPTPSPVPATAAPPMQFPLVLDCSERSAPTTSPSKDGSDSPWIGDTGAAKPPSVNLICWDAPAVGPGAGGR